MKKIKFLLIIMLLIGLFGCVDDSGNDNTPYNVYFLGVNDNVFQIDTVTSESDIVYPIPPIVEGYQFLGWVKDSELANGDVVYKANYQIQSYTVKFHSHDGTLLKTETVVYNTSATPPTEGYTKEGYTFTGWSKEYTNVKSHLEIYPVYALNQVTVTFYDSDNNVLSTQQVEIGEDAIAPTAPIKQGYIFTGWDKDFTNVQTNLEIYPVYNLNVCTVIFYDSDNNVLSTQEVEIGNDAVAPTAPTKPGHTFVSWDKEYTNIQTNLEIYPLYEANKYTVNFYDAEDNVLSTQQVAYGASATAPTAPTKQGYTFTGWDQEFTNVQSNLEIKPQFTQEQYIVKFYDATGAVISEQVLTYGQNATAPTAPSKLGSTFVKWDQEYTNVTSNLDIHPVYQDIYYDVTFVDRDGNVIDTQSVKAYTAAVAPAAPTVDYYTFSNWDKSFSSVTSNLTVTAIYTKNNTSYSMQTADYWLQILCDKYNINQTILNKSQIDYFNQQVLSDYSKTKVVDLNNMDKTVTGTSVSTMINNYTNISSYTLQSGANKTTILNNRNLSAIPTTVTVKFGLIVDFAGLRSYPTNYYSSTDKMDRFHETSLNVGEGVAIYHTSLDGEWCFVQAQNYNGWVMKKYIAECSYEVMTNFLNAADKLLVISDYVLIENAHVRMGQTFPLNSTTSTGYNITFPTRNTDGTLNLKSLTVSKTNDYHVGYLDYTYKNLYVQAFKLLGIDYSWADKLKTGRDCSSTMNAFYSCFGFKMPRNTSNQRKVPTYSETVSGLTTTSIKNYKPGTMIYTSSHVMLYIGEDASGNPYLLHNTNANDAGCILQTLASYGGTKMIGVLKMQ